MNFTWVISGFPRKEIGSHLYMYWKINWLYSSPLLSKVGLFWIKEDLRENFKDSSKTCHVESKSGWPQDCKLHHFIRMTVLVVTITCVKKSLFWNLIFFNVDDNKTSKATKKAKEGKNYN